MSLSTEHGTAAHPPAFYEAQRARERDDQLLRIKRQLYSAAGPVALYKAPPEMPAAQRGSRRRKPADPLLRSEWGDGVTPPHANRGAAFTNAGAGLFKEQSVRLHWLTVTFPVAPERSTAGGMPNVEHVRRIVSERLGQAEDRLRGMWSYASGCQWDEKALLCWTDGRGEACLDLNGATLDFLEPDQQLQLVKQLQAIGGEATRLDAAFDDGQRIASMDEIHAAAAAGNYAGFLKSLPLRERHRDGTLLSDTCAFGTRGKAGSGKYMRIYDKFLESAGIIDAIRYEAELRKEKAADAFQQLARTDDVQGFASIIGKLVAGAISFLDRSRAGENDGHLSRLSLLPWWGKIVAILGRTLIIGRKIVATLQGAATALKRQWGGTLALLRHVLDSQGVNLHAVIDDWCEHFSPRINWKRQDKRNLSLSIPLLLGAA